MKLAQPKILPKKESALRGFCGKMNLWKKITAKAGSRQGGKNQRLLSSV